MNNKAGKKRTLKQLSRQNRRIGELGTIPFLTEHTHTIQKKQLIIRVHIIIY